MFKHERTGSELLSVTRKKVCIRLHCEESHLATCPNESHPNVSAGKTLSYAVPLVQSLQSIQPKVSRSDGPLALIIVPTREVRSD